MTLPIMAASLLVTLQCILSDETDIKPSVKARSIDRARGVRAENGAGIQNRFTRKGNRV